MSDFGMPYLMTCGTVENCAALCHELKLDFVELNISFPACQLETLTPDRLRGLMDRYGIYFTLHMDEEANPFSFNQAVREAWLDTFRRAIVLCRAAEIPVINMHMPKGIYVTLDGVRHFMFAQYRKDYLAQAAALRELCERELNGSEIKICVENTSGYEPYEIEALELLLQSPAFALTLDIGHNHAAGERDWPFYQAHLDRLHHMHAHDCEGKLDHLSWGHGEIDMREKLSHAVVNDARILMEVKTETSLRESVKRMREFLPRTVDVQERMLAGKVHVIIDRPLHSPHPRHPELIYQTNYGFVKGVIAPDWSEQDVYVLGVDRPGREFTGRIIAIIHRNDDVEEKWVAAPEGMTFSVEEIVAKVHFVEQFFDSEIHLV